MLRQVSQSDMLYTVPASGVAIQIQKQMMKCDKTNNFEYDNNDKSFLPQNYCEDIMIALR